jgi:hypothetical protein
LKPFAVYDGKYYELKEIVPWLKNNYPNVDYRTAVQKFDNYHRWGYWLEKLPQNVADKLDYLGFQLDYNIPLNKVRIENVDRLNFSTKRIHLFEKITLDFYELYERGFELELNKTTMLISNVKGKTDLDLDPVTYSAPTITIRGYTSGTPCRLEDIYQADLAGGWGVVSNNNGTNLQYEMTAFLRVGDDVNATWFYIESESLVMKPPFSANGQNVIIVETNAQFTSGVVSDLTGKATRNGGTIHFRGSPTYWSWALVQSGGTIYLYDTRLIATVSVSNVYIGSNSRVWGCQMTYLDYQMQGDTFNCVFNGLYMLRAMGGDVEDIDVYTTNYVLAFYWAGSSVTLRGVTGYSTAVQPIYVASVDGKTLWLIDCSFNNWRILWQVNSTAVIYRQYSFNLNVTDKEGEPISNAEVTLTWEDQGGGSVSATTDANGVITEQILTRGFYNYTGDDTLYDYGEYNLTISALGFFTYTNLFNISDETSYRIALRLENDGLIINTVFDIPLIMLVGMATTFTGIGMLSKDSNTSGTGSVLGMLFWGACWGYWIIQHSTTDLGYFAWVFVAPFSICIFNAWDAVFKEADKGFGRDW